jgi:hypothetical protein
MTSDCPSGKVWSLPSQSLADNLATLLSWANDDRDYRAYECRHCPDWHVTSQAKFSGKDDGDAAQADESGL